MAAGGPGLLVALVLVLGLLHGTRAPRSAVPPASLPATATSRLRASPTRHD
jgi:hypothetical protein